MVVVATSYINESIRRYGIKSVQLSHDSLEKRGQSKYKQLDGLARLEAKIDKLLEIWESK